MQPSHQEKDDWPPPVANKVFRLAMIKAERQNSAANAHIANKPDDILRNKVPIELENILKTKKDSEPKQVKVFIEGAPGCGKSTLSQHICYKWAKNELFQEYKHVLLIRLRDLAIQAADSLSHMVPQRDDSMGDEMASAINTCDGQDALLIFDGWDELPQNAASCSVITSILNSTKLHKCSIIVTSRPITSVSLLKNFGRNYSRIEILGFMKDELNKYFTSCLNNDLRRVETLQQRIQDNPAVAGSCYLPLNASILVHLFINSDDDLPKTEFEIFSALICNCIFRHVQKKKEQYPEISAIQSLDKLPQKIDAPFKRICKIAYEGVEKEKITFDLENDFNTLGLLQGVESFAKGGMPSRSYNFLHLTIQELLAAFHMATQLDNKQQVTQFTKLFGQPRFSAVFRFYAAKTKLNNPGIKAVVTQIVDKCLEDVEARELNSDTDSGSDSDSGHSYHKSGGFNFGHEQQPLLFSLMHCLYEAQDKAICQFVISKLKQLDLHYTNLNPANCLSIGYVLTYCKDFAVNLKECNIGDDGCKALFRESENGDYRGLLRLE